MTNENLEVGKLYEFITENGSYVGIYKSESDDNIIFEDVVKTVIAMMPVGSDENAQPEIRPVPKMEIMNFFTNGKEYSFKKNNILYTSEVVFQTFQQAWKNTIDMYNQMKIQSGTNLTIPTVEDVNNIKKTS